LLSAASSQIENLTASARSIAEAETGVATRHDAAQIVANTRAMEAALAGVSGDHGSFVI
jgi:hypothetical protein